MSALYVPVLTFPTVSCRIGRGLGNSHRHRRNSPRNFFSPSRSTAPNPISKHLLGGRRDSQPVISGLEKGSAIFSLAEEQHPAHPILCHSSLTLDSPNCPVQAPNIEGRGECSVYSRIVYSPWPSHQPRTAKFLIYHISSASLLSLLLLLSTNPFRAPVWIGSSSLAF